MVPGCCAFCFFLLLQNEGCWCGGMSCGILFQLRVQSSLLVTSQLRIRPGEHLLKPSCSQSWGSQHSALTPHQPQSTLEDCSCLPGNCGAAPPQRDFSASQWAAITPSPMKCEPQLCGGGSPLKLSFLA